MFSVTRFRSISAALVLVAPLVVPARAPGQSARALKPEDVTLSTKDGVQLRITYYPSSAGQQAVPVVMLHDFNETRAVFDPLARRLSDPTGGLGDAAAPGTVVNLSRAVVAVDLRGHGDSKTIFSRSEGGAKLDAQRLGVGDFQDMVQLDMEAVRSFLVERNDAGQLNLNKLCLVGSGMGADVAILWAAKDWATPPLPVRKQSQDVKALVLLSPRWNFRGLGLVEAMKFPPVQRELSVLLAYGKNDRKVAAECENIDKILARYHPVPPPDRASQQDYFVFAPNTKLQGSELLNTREFGMPAKIAGFIEARLGGQDFPYVPRVK